MKKDESDEIAPSIGSSLRSYISSDRFSVIECSRDNYAEDIIIQKVIYYISLFHPEVSRLLKGEEENGEVDELQ